MAEKQRYTVTLPDHVADTIAARSKPLGATPTEYAGHILRWWYGQGCPPVTHDEAALLAVAMKKRLKPVPDDLNVWVLDEKSVYAITDDKIVEKLLSQLGLPNLFAQAVEHDEVRLSVAFDNHPTHWLVFDYFKGGDAPEKNGLSFNAYPKVSTPRAQMLDQLQAMAKQMSANKPFTFSQIPILEKKASGNQTATREVPAS
jgi:hypothetical protein